MTSWEVKRCILCCEDVPDRSSCKRLSDHPVRQVRTSRQRRPRSRFVRHPSFLPARGESPPKQSRESKSEPKACIFSDKIVYRKMLETNFPVLSSGDGLSMLQQLGLEGFFKQPAPPFKLAACDEFISSFQERTSSGTVQGRTVVLSPMYVALASRLPLQEEGDQRRFFTHTVAAREHNMGHLVYGEDNKLVRDIGALVAVKLWCRDKGYRRAKQDVLLALDRSIQLGIQMNWAHHLYVLMVKSITKVADKANRGSVVYPFGEWLSKIIEDQLEGVTLRVHGSMREVKMNREDARKAVKTLNSSTDLDVEVVIRPKGTRAEREEILQLKKRVRQLEEGLQQGKDLVSKLFNLCG